MAPSEANTSRGVSPGAGGPRRYALLHPLGAAVLIGICIRAAGHLRRGRAIEWRGTSY
jgi:hypothetical protein